MDEDLEGPNDDDPFNEGRPKGISQNVEDVMGKDWWSDDEDDEKKALETKISNSDDECNTVGNACIEFNEHIDVNILHLKLKWSSLIIRFSGSPLLNSMCSVVLILNGL